MKAENTQSNRKFIIFVIMIAAIGTVLLLAVSAAPESEEAEPVQDQPVVSTGVEVNDFENEEALIDTTPETSVPETNFIDFIEYGVTTNNSSIVTLSGTLETDKPGRCQVTYARYDIETISETISDITATIDPSTNRAICEHVIDRNTLSNGQYYGEVSYLSNDGTTSALSSGFFFGLN